jgi:hypothetical protein
MMRFRLAPFLLGLLFTLMGLANPQAAHAQFIGFTSPQTVDATLATATTCTGAAQNYITGVNPTTFRNLGQTQHYASAAAITGAIKFQMEIDGIDNKGNVFRLSDTLELPGAGSTQQGAVTGSGRFPQIQVKVTCSPNTATYTLTYSGTSATFGGQQGAFLFAQIDKINFFQATDTNQSDTFQTPFGNSSGTLYFQFTGSADLGSTIAINCFTAQSVAATVALNIPTPPDTALHGFPIPALGCPLAQVIFTAGSGGAASVTAEYIFNTPGNAYTAPQYSNAHITTTTATSVKLFYGLLHTLNINTSAAGTVSVFDLGGTACTGTPVTNVKAIITVGATDPAKSMFFDTTFTNGICVKASAAMDLTVTYN